MTLAKSSLELAQKVGANDVTADDITIFNDATNSFEIDAFKDILTEISSIANASIINGARLGFAVSGPAGALLGGTAFGFVRTLAAVGALWNFPTDPRQGMIQAAKNIEDEMGHETDEARASINSCVIA